MKNFNLFSFALLTISCSNQDHTDMRSANLKLQLEQQISPENHQGIELAMAENFDFKKSLLIHNPLVINGSESMPEGALHFSSLISQMLPEDASNRQISDLIVNWAKTWSVNQQVNSDVATLRPEVTNAILCDWVAKSGGTNCLPPSSGLNLRFAPFRLIAITNRLDLMDNSRCEETAGEGRLIYALLDQATDRPQFVGNALPATFIFEYKLPTQHLDGSKTSAVDWAKRWGELNDLNCSETDCDKYNAKLVEIIRAFSDRDVQAGAPNGNSLGQIRTNELIQPIKKQGRKIITQPWQLREFNLVMDSATKSANLKNVSTKQNPAEKLNNTKSLVNVLRTNWQAISQGSFDWFKSSSTRSMLGASAISSGTLVPSQVWLSKISNSQLAPTRAEGAEVRTQFVASTCDGCHQNQTGSTPNIGSFYHISHKGEISKFTIDDSSGRRTEHMLRLMTSNNCSDFANSMPNKDSSPVAQEVKKDPGEFGFSPAKKFQNSPH